MSFKFFPFFAFSFFPGLIQGPRLSLFPQRNRYRKPSDCRRGSWFSLQRAAHKPKLLSQVFFAWVTSLVMVRPSWRRRRRKQPPPSCVRSTSPAACISPAAATYYFFVHLFTFIYPISPLKTLPVNPQNMGPFFCNPFCLLIGGITND